MKAETLFKTILAAFIAAVMCVGFTACGDDKEDEPQSSQTNTSNKDKEKKEKYVVNIDFPEDCPLDPETQEELLKILAPYDGVVIRYPAGTSQSRMAEDMEERCEKMIEENNAHVDPATALDVTCDFDYYLISQFSGTTMWSAVIEYSNGVMSRVR